MILHLSEHHGDGAPGATLFVETAGLDALHAEVSAKNYRYLRPGIEDAPWRSAGHDRRRFLLEPHPLQREKTGLIAPRGSAEAGAQLGTSRGTRWAIWLFMRQEQ